MTNENNISYILSQEQYAICLYFAMTINKSQSKYLKTARVDL